MPWFMLPPGLSASNPANYMLIGAQPTCPGANKICAINAALGTGGKPIISNSLQNEMIDALNMHTNYPNVMLSL